MKKPNPIEPCNISKCSETVACIKTGGWRQPGTAGCPVPFIVTAEVEIGQTGADGVLAAIGGIISGWSLYVKEGKPTFYYNFFEVEHTKVQSSETLTQGKASIRVEFTPVEPGPGKPANVRLLVNDKEVGQGYVARTVPFRYSGEPFDIGMDTVSAVSEDYKAPFPFQSRIDQVTIDVK